MKRAIIIGAGPAGLTAAYELLTRTDVVPIVLEKSTYMGGISRTVNYKGNRIDIGGHRFFSKSDRVMKWWLQHMPIQCLASTNGASNGNGALKITYQQKSREVDPVAEAPDPSKTDTVMLVRSRKSRIYFLRRFFDYPISLSKNTLANLGIARTIKIGCSYIRSVIFPVKNEQNLEEFFINRFGRELYKTFFKSYTEKVWGVPCNEISAEWGAQRIKGLSITKTLRHMLKKALGPRKRQDVAQKDTETSLIEQFLYPKLGPGQMWEIVARKIEEMGGRIITGFDVTGIRCEGSHIRAVRGTDSSGSECEFSGDYFFSTMPVKELVRALETNVPANVQEVSDGLMYRDFITVGLLLNKLKVAGSVKEKASGNGNSQAGGGKGFIDDNWIYIQEPEVFAGRLQIFNNWSPHMVANPDHVWIGVEYFCYEGDGLWTKTDAEMSDFARKELASIGIIEPDAVLDSTVIRMPKTYPAYFGAYSRFEEIRNYVDAYANLFLVGRNGMHKYNNQDHSMLTAMIAVDNIIEGRTDKANLWDVNTEMEYHETKDKQPEGNVTASVSG